MLVASWSNAMVGDGHELGLLKSCLLESGLLKSGLLESGRIESRQANLELYCVSNDFRIQI